VLAALGRVRHCDGERAPRERRSTKLAQEMWKRADSLDHLTAKAEMELRRTRAQLRATSYMLIASIAAAGCVLASATGTMKACEWFKSAGLRGECPRCRTRAASFYHERAARQVVDWL
jgi:hypothetical protein